MTLHRRQLMKLQIHAEIKIILLTKTTAGQNEVALSYHNVRGLYFLTVAFVATIICLLYNVHLQVHTVYLI